MTIAIDYIYKGDASSIGLNIAINDFTKSWLHHTKEKLIICHSHDQLSQQHFFEMAKEAKININERCGVLNPLETPERLHNIDCLFIPDPDISKPIWQRANINAKHALCGLVHSMSGEQVSKVVSDLCIAPSKETDALICPSKSIKDSIHNLWDIYCEYLSYKFKTKITCPVQTPIIPIGINTKTFEEKVTKDKRKEQREKLNCDEDEVVILFVGRLNFATKAHPLPLLLSALKAAKQTKKKVRLVIYGYFTPREEMKKRFHALINDFKDDNLKCDIIENTDERFPDGVLAAADIFTSLVDNIQESFGLTPIEAMACSLPTVITDWDGYKDSVRDGIDGFLIPTYTPPIEAGMEIATTYLNQNNYGHYLMANAQSTIIDIDAASNAFLTLIENPEKRKEMGASGNKYAKEKYDWESIIPLYEKLWNELGEKTENQKNLMPDNWQALSPTYPNPYKIFESFPTNQLKAETKIQIIISDEEISKTINHDMNYFVKELLSPMPLILTLIETIRSNEAISIGEVLSVSPEIEHQRLWRTIAWLLKHGIARQVK